MKIKKTKTKIILLISIAIALGLSLLYNSFADSQTGSSVVKMGMGIGAPDPCNFEQEYLDIDRGIQLNWSMPEQSYVDGFKITETISGSLTNTYFLTGSNAGDLRSYTVEGIVTNNTNYEYKISALLSYTGNTIYSNECIVNLNTGVPPNLGDYCSGGTAFSVSKLPISFVPTGEGKLTNINTDAGQGKYITHLYDLGESNKAGTVKAIYSGPPVINSNTLNYSISGNSTYANMIDYVVHRKEMYNDNSINSITNANKGDRTNINVFIRDQQGRPVINNTQVKVKRVDTGIETNLCTTTDGKCSGEYIIPSEIFNSSGMFSVKITASGVESDQYDFIINQKSSNLNLNSYTAGIDLPDSELFPGATFRIPVYINSSSFNAFDISLNYDSSIFEYKNQIDAGSGVPGWSIIAGSSAGVINFNANNATAASGNLVHVATVYMGIKSSATQGSSGSITASLIKLEKVGVGCLPSDPGGCPGYPKSIVIKDLSYTGSSSDYSGYMTARLIKEAGFIASGGEYQLFNTTPLTNVDVTTPITTTSYYNNSSSSQTTPSSCTSNNSSIASKTGTCTIKSEGIGNTYFDVVKSVNGSNLTRKVYINVYSPISSNPYDIDFDNQLNYISEISSYQLSDVKFKTTFSDGNGDVTVDTSSLVDISVSGPFTYDVGKISRNGVGTGNIVVKQKGTSSTLRTESILSSSESDTVSIKKLLVLLPKTITTSMNGASFTPGIATKEVNANVKSALTSEGDTVDSYVYLDLSDGNIQKIDNSLLNFYAYRGSGNIAISGSDIITVSSGGRATALTEKGLGIVRAELKSNPSKKGDGYTCANLPDPLSITVYETVSHTQLMTLAENSSSPVVTHKGLSTQGTITVIANYSGGTIRDMTNDARTSYSEITSDGGKFTLSGNVVTSANLGTTNSGQVMASVDFGGGTIFTGAVTVKILGMRSENPITLNAIEHYTPTGQTINDLILNKIEGSNTYQNAYLEAVEYYSDGTSQFIARRNQGNLFNDVYFFTDDGSVVDFEPAASYKNFLLPNSIGSTMVSVQSGLSTKSGTYLYRAATGITVTDTSVDISSFTLTRGNPDNYSLHGYKNVTTKNILGYVTFSDDTRRYIVGSDKYIGNLISGLLDFTSGNTQVAIINTGGTMTLKGNGVANINVDVVSDKDVGNNAIAWNKNIAGNLYPEVGDVDLGSINNLPLNSDGISSGTIITVPMRMNAGSYNLGSFTVEVLYDSSIFTYSGVTKGSALSAGFTLSPNGTAGTRSGKTILSIPGYESGQNEINIGANGEVAKIQFIAKTNTSGATLNGDILEILGNNGTVTITKNKPIVAGDNIFINGPSSLFAYEKQTFFGKVMAFVKGLFNIKDTSSMQANILSEVYIQSGGMLPKIGDITPTGCEVTSGDARGVQLYLAKDANFMSQVTERENLLGDAFPNLQGTGGISGLDALFINNTVSRNKHYLEGISKSRSGSNVTFRVYTIDTNQRAVTGTLTVQLEADPFSNGSGTLYNMTNDGINRYYEYTLTNAPSTGTIVVHIRDNSASTPVTASFQYSKKTDIDATYTAIANYDDQNNEGHFDNIFGKYYPVGCGNDLNFPPYEIALSSLTFPENSLSGTVVGGLSTLSYDNGASIYEFAEPFGDNSKFTIDGNQLKLNQNLGTGSYRLRIRTIDDGASNGKNILWYEQQFTLTASGSASTKPTALSFNIGIDEEQVYTFSGSVFSDNFLLGSGGVALQKIKIISLPTNGDLYIGGTVTYSGRTLITTGSTKITSTGVEIDYNDIGTLQYAPNVDVDTTDSFDWNGYNGNFYSESGAILGFSINPIGDTPKVGTGETLAYQQTQTGIVIQRNDEDGNEVTHFRITNITNGLLFKSDGITPILNGDYITINEGVLGVKFTSNSTDNGYFDAESAQSSGVLIWVSAQSDKSRSYTNVTPVGDVSCGGPDSITFTNQASTTVDNPVTFDMVTESGTGNYFWCEDMRGSNTLGWELTAYISDLTQSGSSFTPIDAYNRIKIYKGSSTGFVTLEGSTHALLETNIDDTERRFGSGSNLQIGVLRVDSIAGQSNVLGKWGIQPTLKVVIPAYQNPGPYKGVITLTLDKNIAF